MRAINVNLKPFDWMNVSSLCSYARDFVPNVARSTTVLVYKPSGRDEGSYTWAAVEAVSDGSRPIRKQTQEKRSLLRESK